jgi:hypothetical protein
MENQSLAGHVPRAGSVICGGAAAVPVSTYSPVAVYTPTAPRFRAGPRRSAPHARRRHAVHLRLAAVLAGVIARGSSALNLIRYRGRRPVSATTVPSAPPCITALRSASEYFRSPPRTRITDGCSRLARRGLLCPAFPAFIPSPPALTSTARTGSAASVLRATSVCFCRSSTITGAATELACCHSRACPAEGGLAGRLVQLRLGGNHVRRPLPAQSHTLPWPACRAAFCPAACLPDRCPDRNRSRSPSRCRAQTRRPIPRNVHLVRGKLQAAVFHARIQRQVQPLARALIDGAARRGPQGAGGWLRAGLGRRLLRQHHMAIDTAD